MEKQQTAVEWLESQFANIDENRRIVFDKAKQMEKEQIIEYSKQKGYTSGWLDGIKQGIEEGNNKKASPQTEKCCTPEGQIKRYLDCIGCDKKPS